MSLGTNVSQRSVSPSSQGTSTPSNPKGRRNKDDDNLLKRDKGYRRYASGVERVLSQFDTALEEWADYISFLGRLLKALQSKPTGLTDIPHKGLVSKRLSQCLNPTLPSGVHQKTLDVYTYIFVSLGKDGLSKDLTLYLPGLEPVLSFASLSVKPALLKLFEDHVVAINSHSLRRALKAILLALLPGLEEESSEEFERTLNILAAFKEAIGRDVQENEHDLLPSGHQYFWQCLFSTSITSSSRRSGMLAYLVRNLPRLGFPLDHGDHKIQMNGHSHNKNANNMLKFPPDIEVVISPDPGLLIRCFYAGLRDHQLLIQRGFLDLLVTHLPLNSPVFVKYRVVSEDLRMLVIAATSVVARRDMSLNRRLWSWFLGPDSLTESNESQSTPPKSPESDLRITPSREGLESQTQYFERYGLDPLVQSIEGMITTKSVNATERARPLRVCLSLMDRWEIGGLVIPRIFFHAIRSVWRYESLAPSPESYAEVLRSANVFFDGVESGLIWTQISKIIECALSLEDINDVSAHEFLNIVLFVTNNFNLREEEMLIVHMPTTCLILLLRVQAYIQRFQVSRKIDCMEVSHIALKITSRLVDLIPARAFRADTVLDGVETFPMKKGDTNFKDIEILSKAQYFYIRCLGNLDLTNPPFTPECLGRLLLQRAINLMTEVLQNNTKMAFKETSMAIFDTLIRKVSSEETELLDLKQFHASLSGNLIEIPPNELRFPAVAAKVSTLEIICTAPQTKTRSWVPEWLMPQLIPNLIKGIWLALSPSSPKHNVEAVRSLWRLQSVCPDKQLIESTLTSLMISDRSVYDEPNVDIESARRIGTLWTHSLMTSTTSAQGRRSSRIQVRQSSAKPQMMTQNELFLLERPLLLLLDVLEDSKSHVFPFVTSWLQNLPNLDGILDLLIIRLDEILNILESTPLSSNEENNSVSPLNLDNLDLNLCVYYLSTTLNLIQYSSINVWSALANFRTSHGDKQLDLSKQVCLTKICLKLLAYHYTQYSIFSRIAFKMDQNVLSLIRHFLLGPLSALLLDMNLETALVEELLWAIGAGEISLQVSLIEVILVLLKIGSSSDKENQSNTHRRTGSRDTIGVPSNLSNSTEKTDQKGSIFTPSALPPKLMDCLMLGLTSRSSRPVLESWIAFLDYCLPLYADGIFQVLIPLIECFCKTLGSVFRNVQAIFGESGSESSDTFEPTLALLLNGLEQSLATSHERLMTSELNNPPIKSPEPQQGFFGNMVSGVFTSETNRSRNMTANNRLTVLLCFKDAVRLCFNIWSWGGFSGDGPLQDPSASASFNYTIIRLRNRTRRIFEHLFAAEALECLETLIELWYQSTTGGNAAQSNAIFNLLHVLDGSRPKNTIPAIFNAIYSRTNPSVLEPVRKSTLTSNLSDTTLSAFLVEYARSLDDDAMDEIWTDCMTFLRDVLANPMPHRQTLARLLEFTALLGEKVDNTNFGEQRKMRRELGDLFVRLLTATLTIRPIGFSHEAPQRSSMEKAALDTGTNRSNDIRTSSQGSDGIVPVLASITPNLSKILTDSDRIAATATVVSTQVIGPTIRSKSFPENVTKHTLDLLLTLAGITEASKAWKRDVTEAFNDAKFFASSVGLVEHGWLPILRQWVLSDKERIPEMFSRLPTPTAAGLVFGVGASSARLEADRKTQLNLRRIAILILAAPNDTFAASLTGLQEKLVDLLNATSTSSPSSITRSEIYMVIRALVLKSSPVHMSSLWPIINSELQDVLSSAFPAESRETFDVLCLLQACKLLDTLLTLGLDDFQLYEWLFITDTTDAIVYRPSNGGSIALIDELKEVKDGLDSSNSGSYQPSSLSNTIPTGKRRPLLSASLTKEVKRERLMETVLRPFFRQLSIHVFESTYSMEEPDWTACSDDLIADLFDDGTLV